MLEFFLRIKLSDHLKLNPNSNMSQIYITTNYFPSDIYI